MLLNTSDPEATLWMTLYYSRCFTQPLYLVIIPQLLVFHQRYFSAFTPIYTLDSNSAIPFPLKPESGINEQNQGRNFNQRANHAGKCLAGVNTEYANRNGYC